jgi:ribonuclease T2
MRLLILAILSLLAGLPVRAEGERAGDFDYYLLALSWSPAWCALTGDARHDPQCDPGRGLTFMVHGLWPQNETGYPSDCFTTQSDPSRADTAAMTDIMGGAGLAFYEWQKHGRCSGLPARDYFATLRRARTSITIPPVFARITHDLTIDAGVIQDAFLEKNPQLRADGVTITCKQGKIQEVRICLTRDLAPRRCGTDVVRDCTLPDAELDAVR